MAQARPAGGEDPAATARPPGVGRHRHASVSGRAEPARRSLSGTGFQASGRSSTLCRAGRFGRGTGTGAFAPDPFGFASVPKRLQRATALSAGSNRG